MLGVGNVGKWVLGNLGNPGLWAWSVGVGEGSTGRQPECDSTHSYFVRGATDPPLTDVLHGS